MPRLWAITLFVYNVDEAVEFYKDILGFSLLENSSNEGLAIFDLGGVPFLVRVPEAGEEWRRPGVGTNLFIEVDDVDDVSKKMTMSRGKILFGPEMTATGQVNMGVEDPFGNELILTSKAKN
jgi:catechol 2,3-dioxygenase-like lactoylglutathione lyase family enzyme